MAGTVFEMNGTTLTAKPEGELDSMTSPVFEAELRAHLAGAENVIVDFENVEYISSAGLRALLAVDRSLEGAEMKLIHVNELIMEIFEMVCFTDMIRVE